MVNEIIFKNDTIKFYTSVAAWNSLYKIIEPKIMRAKYWNGPNHCVAHIPQKIKYGPTFKNEITFSASQQRLRTQI